MASGSQHEPFFLRFRRELIHHEKSALSNPAQLLRLLTGQEHLHHRFVLVSDTQRKTASDTAPPKAAPPKALSAKAEAIRHEAGARRREKAENRACEALQGDLLKMISRLESQASPEAADRLLLDIVLGTGRIVDDLRTLANLRKVVPFAGLRLEAVRQVLVHLMAGIIGMRPLEMDLPEERLQALLKMLGDLEEQEASSAQLQVSSDTARRRDDAFRKCLRVLERSDKRLGGRTLQGLKCNACGHMVPIDGTCTRHMLVSHGCGALRRAVFGPRAPVQRAYGSADLQKLACRLLVLVDIALGFEYASAFGAECASIVGEARGLAFGILQQTFPSRSNWELQLLLLGCELRPRQQLHDPRVPWPADAWQVKLLDAVDARCGSLVLAPTSAGKTFAAYYVMEAALRSSNTAAVLCVVPTIHLAGQIEAEVYARFAQKPYPHDGFKLCGALIPGRPRSSMSAQVVITTPERLQETLEEDELWERLQWVVCDEIHMQPLPLMKALAQHCGKNGVPLLAMSATIQNPQRLRENLAKSACSPEFSLIEHSERVVDLHTLRWTGVNGGLQDLHPLLLVRSSRITRGAVPNMAPPAALRLWDVLRAVVPSVAGALDPANYFLRARFAVLGRRSPLQTNGNILSLISGFLGEQMMSRQEFRSWERSVVASLASLSSVHLDSVLSELAGHDSVEEKCDSNVPGPRELLHLLQGLRGADLLPCICFQRSAESTEILALGLAEILHQEGRQRIESSRLHTRQLQAEQRATYELKLEDLRSKLEQARIRASGRGQDSKDESGNAGDAIGEPKRNASSAPLADMWGNTGKAEYEHENHNSREARSSRQAAKKVEGDPGVRAARVALEAMKQCPPDLEGANLSPDLDFMAMRAQHTYGTEIHMLVKYVEQGIRDVGKTRDKLWSQALIAALGHGVALHFASAGCEGMNFAVQLLFRMGHVRVLLADESLGCGINLPCRAAVILDPEICGAALTQMAGRAGRRGLDLAGATVFVHDLETLQDMHGGSSPPTQQSSRSEAHA